MEILQWLKYVVVGFGIVFVIVIAGFLYNQHSTNVTTIQEVDTLLKVNETGKSRDLQEGRLSKDEVIADIIKELVEVQKSHENDLRINYVFLDEEGEATEDEVLIESIQFEVN